MENEFTLLKNIYTWLLENGMELATNFIVSIIVLIAAKIVISVVLKGLKAALKRSGKVSEILEKFSVNVLRKIMWGIAIIIILGQFGIDIGPLIAGLGVTGFILGFAFQETIGNMLSGVMISLNKPFGIGEYVDIGGVSGTVKDMDMISITLHTPDNKKIVMANKVVWGKPITNFSALDTRRIDMIFGISYGSDIKQAKDIIKQEFAKLPEILSEPEPIIEVFSLGDSSVNFAVRPWVNKKDYWKIFYALNQMIKYAFDEAGIEIPFPQVDVHHHGSAEVQE
ncbi:MAG: mechanosensitive ion channel family protein [Spirochaetales bacterium]|nr:mechanosensitive ion channel family protein [Spirochaetales bacterium]